MKREDIKNDLVVRNIKHGVDEKILHTGIMKVNGEWVDCVVYTGKDRFGKGNLIFVKSMNEFLEEFEISPDNELTRFNTWMEKVYSLLCKNMSDEDKEKNVCFLYTEMDIDKKLRFFFNCFIEGMSPYTSLTLFTHEQHTNNQSI